MISALAPGCAAAGPCLPTHPPAPSSALQEEAARLGLCHKRPRSTGPALGWPLSPFPCGPTAAKTLTQPLLGSRHTRVNSPFETLLSCPGSVSSVPARLPVNTGMFQKG